MIEAFINSAGQLVGNVVSGVFNASAQNKANAMNYRIMKEQNAYNERMWNLNNAYNTPNEQKKRLLAAGINPSLAMSNISTGTSQGAVTAAGSPQMVAPQIGNPFAGVGQSFSDMMTSLQQSKLIDAQIEKTKAEADATSKLAGNTIENDKLNRESTKVQIETANFTLEQFKEFKPYQKKLLLNQIEEVGAKAGVDRSVEAMNWESVKTSPLIREKYKAELKQIIATAAYLYSNKKLTDEQAKLCIKQAATEEARKYNIEASTLGLKLDNYTKNINADILTRSKEDIINLKYYESLSKKYEAAKRKSEHEIREYGREDPYGVSGYYVEYFYSILSSIIPLASGFNNK